MHLHSYKGIHTYTTTHTIYSHTPCIHTHPIFMYQIAFLKAMTNIFLFLNFLMPHAIIKDEYRNTNLIFFKLEITKYEDVPRRSDSRWGRLPAPEGPRSSSKEPEKPTGAPRGDQWQRRRSLQNPQYLWNN